MIQTFVRNLNEKVLDVSILTYISCTKHPLASGDVSVVSCPFGMLPSLEAQDWLRSKNTPKIFLKLKP